MIPILQKGEPTLYARAPRHFSDCDVCEGSRQVAVRTIVPTEVSLLGQNSWPWLRRPTKLALVIACPQCAGAEELLAHLPSKPGDAR